MTTRVGDRETEARRGGQLGGQDDRARGRRVGCGRSNVQSASRTHSERIWWIFARVDVVVAYDTGHACLFFFLFSSFFQTEERDRVPERRKTARCVGITVGPGPSPHATRSTFPFP